MQVLKLNCALQEPPTSMQLHASIKPMTKMPIGLAILAARTSMTWPCCMVAMSFN